MYALAAHLQTFDDKVEPGSQPPAAKPSKRAGSNAPTGFDLRGELYRISGTDLTQIDGINIMTAQTIIAEVGVDMSRFPTEAHFATFLGLCPDNQITGGRVRHRGTKHVQNRAATALRMAASTLWRSKTYLGGQVPALVSSSGGIESHYRHGPHAGPARLPHAPLRRAIRRQRDAVLRGKIPSPRDSEHSEKAKQLGFEVTLSPAA
jgi:hypothetical protein